MKLKVANWIDPTLNHLWDMRKQIIEDAETDKAHLGDIFGFYFGYPDYAGLPAKVSKNIPDNLAQIIHEETYYVLKNKAKTKKAFFKEMLKALTDNTVELS